ncbi:hypothetical protein SDC9_198229 [bioreactor metagenome]|uniref:Uncharacterized protein n=1 Tax=bioreactor metagenome TaxID=1076179 RepID=A0A645IH23_9ZZZZ
MPILPACATSIPSGRLPFIGKSQDRPTGSPASRAEEISLISRGSKIRRSFSTAQTSTANRPFISVAVVITAVAPKSSATSWASLLAPPICPDRMGITNLPPSSMTRTAGSFSFPFKCGATVRTAMPAAPIKMIPFLALKAFFVNSPRSSLRQLTFS